MTKRSKKKIKTIWHQKRLHDPYFKEAKIKGYRSRSALKLLDINKKFRILKKAKSWIRSETLLRVAYVDV